MAKQILLSCFSDGVTTVVAEMLRGSNVIRVAAGFTINLPGAEADDPNLKWLHCDRDIATYRDIMPNIELLVSLSHNSYLAEIVRLAVHYQKPLICVTTSLTPKQQEILNRAARYVPVIYYKNTNENLAQIMDSIARCIEDPENFRITGRVTNFRA